MSASVNSSLNDRTCTLVLSIRQMLCERRLTLVNNPPAFRETDAVRTETRVGDRLGTADNLNANSKHSRCTLTSAFSKQGNPSVRQERREWV